jgi:LysM repeat protein
MRRTSSLTLSAITAALALSTPAAQAAVPHTVEPGETLWSIAAASNLTTRTLAAYNGLPRTRTWCSAPRSTSRASRGHGRPERGRHHARDDRRQRRAGERRVRPAARGRLHGQAGDTFSGLAAKAGTTPQQVAGVNGLSLEPPAARRHVDQAAARRRRGGDRQHRRARRAGDDRARRPRRP